MQLRDRFPSGCATPCGTIGGASNSYPYGFYNAYTTYNPPHSPSWAGWCDDRKVGPGARGPHVEKIQTALNILDSAGLGVDGRYGPATATAVLNYKTKRNIINRSYQTSADNIVGKMTMAKLDEEMRAQETKPSARIIITPISPALNRDKAIPSHHLRITPSNSFVAGSSSSVASIGPPVFGIASVTIDPGQTADIDIKNGAGYHLALTEFQFATNSPSAVMLV